MLRDVQGSDVRTVAEGKRGRAGEDMGITKEWRILFIFVNRSKCIFLI